MKLITNCAQDANFIDPAVSWVELLDNAKTIRPSKQVLVLIQFFFLVRGRSRSGQSLKIDLFIKKKKTPKKKKRKKNKIERETNKKHSSTWHVMLCVSCSCECIECLRKPSFICVNLKFKYITINYGIYIQRGSVTMNNRKLKTQRFIL